MVGHLKAWARIAKRDAHALYFAARDPRVPWYARALALTIAGYACSPLDLIPDFIPVIGLVDDLIIVPAGIVLVIRMIPAEVLAEHRETAARLRAKPASRSATIAVVSIWLGAIAVSAWLTYRFFAG
jgi:uncharacterized membrane protein YkvA (DUF1232 family)